MAQAKTGDSVQVHYTGRLQDGTVFDTSREREPLQFVLGQGQVIPGFENAVVGLEPGQSTTAEIAPENGYGDRRDDLVLDVERDRLPDDMDPQVGQQLQLRQQNGQAIPVTVTGVNDSAVTIDANHPLAGQMLVFDIELVDIG